MSKKIILRIESSVGTRRIQINPSETVYNLFEKVHTEFELLSYSFALFKQRSQIDEVACSKSRTVADVGLQHGDKLYMTPINGAVIFPQISTTTNNTPSGDPGKFESLPSTSSSADSSLGAGVSSAKKHIKVVKEDDVDVQLSKLDGKIERRRDEKLCHHVKNALCIHCCPLEPSDESYLREHNIKHMSFNSYLRKLTSDISGGKFAAMEDTSCRIKIGCKDHLPWPKGICSKCQPNAVTLNRQIYRHVDNIQFDNTQIVERFLNYWRTTGLQRFGFLYGNYEIHPDVPLGIKATVAAIYEPPQENEPNCIRVLKDDKEELVDQIAAGLGLRRVGYIFTDLVAQDLQKGTVKHTRNANTHFLTAQECITSGKYQNMYPNPTKLSSNGYYGSKFVTVCLTGDKLNQVHMEGYQVSNQCMALVRDDCLVPTKDAPELGYVRESSDRQYVPDVFYKDKDSYGNEVPKMARPLPVEYLLVDVPASTPLTPHYTFNCDVSKDCFPIENRIIDGQVQDFTALARYMGQFPTLDQFPNAMNDFHLLLYIAAMDTLPMKDYMGPLLEAIHAKDAEAVVEWSKSEQWATVVQLIAATNSSPPHSRPTSVAGTSTFSSSGEVQWTCPFCTFLNSSDTDTCEMCTLPRSSVPQ